MKKPRCTMGYTVEILSAIVRVGKGHHALGDPFAFSVVVASVDGKVGVIKALTKPKEDEAVDFSHGHSKQVLRGVAALGLKPDWTRMVPGRPVRRHKRTKRTKI